VIILCEEKVRALEPHVFVYGTLMTAAPHASLGAEMRARLQREALSLGAATMRGRLYDLGRYPGMVTGDGLDELVHGEVFRLNQPAGALAWLDAYEDVRPHDPTSEYERALRTARLASGGDIAAWVYLYRGNLERAPHIADGRWVPQAVTGRNRS
jgi:gamma-glutamylcyclotransferase (GGCT)/AIG2-like uncharacterized protein YtfP